MELGKSTGLTLLLVKPAPPPYTNSLASSKTSPQKASCNYTRVVRELGPIEETFVVDHSIRVNEEFLPSLTDEQRKAEGGRNNLYLKAKYGDVNVDIHIEKDSPTAPSKKPVDTRFPDRVKLMAESGKGDVLMRLHAPSRENRRPLHLSINAHSGSIFVLLPRSITGTVNVTANKQPVVVTGDLSKITNIISEDGKARKLIIGDLKGPWKQVEKDEIVLSASRRVYLQYVDEKFEKPDVEGGCIVA
ncbi:hypothetical protein V5O48_012669 [Marasmius crinis-equi]|uniref:DUF7330 domain-containing protein n=1 Tax=Marasmius crinis-equi TaxID=585013 RepID=A0ABR3F278_9AGAR